MAEVPSRQLERVIGDGRNPLRELPASPEAPGVYDWYHNPEGGRIPRVRSLEQRLRNVYVETADRRSDQEAEDPEEVEDPNSAASTGALSAPPAITPRGGASYEQPTMSSLLKRASLERRLYESKAGEARSTSRVNNADGLADISETSLFENTEVVTAGSGAHACGSESESAKFDGKSVARNRDITAVSLHVTGGFPPDDSHKVNSTGLKPKQPKPCMVELEGEECVSKPKQPKPCMVVLEGGPDTAEPMVEEDQAQDGKEPGENEHEPDASLCHSDSGPLEKEPPMSYKECREETRPNEASGPSLDEIDRSRSSGSDAHGEVVDSGKASEQHRSAPLHKPTPKKKRKGIAGRFLACFTCHSFDHTDTAIQ